MNYKKITEIKDKKPCNHSKSRKSKIPSKRGQLFCCKCYNYFIPVNKIFRQRIKHKSSIIYKHKKKPGDLKKRAPEKSAFYNILNPIKWLFKRKVI